MCIPHHPHLRSQNTGSAFFGSKAPSDFLSNLHAVCVCHHSPAVRRTGPPNCGGRGVGDPLRRQCRPCDCGCAANDQLDTGITYFVFHSNFAPFWKLWIIFEISSSSGITQFERRVKFFGFFFVKTNFGFQFFSTPSGSRNHFCKAEGTHLRSRITKHTLYLGPITEKGESKKSIIFIFI